MKLVLIEANQEPPQSFLSFVSMVLEKGIGMTQGWVVTLLPHLSFKPTFSMLTIKQCTCYKCKQQGHLASSCLNKTNKNSSGLFILTTGYDDNDPPNDVYNNDDNDPPTNAIYSGFSLGSFCDKINSYYKYCCVIKKLVENSLDHNPYD
ncbi:hypothetical protein QOT17_013864 [Balamuthia mandrillaris]